MNKDCWELSELQSYVEAQRALGKKIVTTNGCFDLLHRGHVTYLEQAKEQGDLLIVAVNSDESVKSYKGPDRPLNTAKDRAYVLSKLRSVDAVFIFNERLPNDFLKVLKPDIHVKGGDYKAEELPEYAVLKSLGAEIVIIPFVDGYSTTSIISKF